MKLLTKILLVTFIFLSNITYSQNITYQDVNTVVQGIVYDGNQQYLVTDKGYIKIENKNKRKSENDQWTEYYRKAHGDSSIKNPNTIIEQPSLNIPIQFFYPLGGRGWIDKEYGFEEDAYLYDFVQADEYGNYAFRPGILGIIGGMQKKPRGK
ncbi:MAG: hypothetical protein L3J41_07045 [Melioribacteraceae bacterium]|nr:hypothetical protein [Melioribacteraceae bacterium]